MLMYLLTMNRLYTLRNQYGEVAMKVRPMMDKTQLAMYSGEKE